MRLGNGFENNAHTATTKGASAEQVAKTRLSLKVRRERYAIVGAKACEILDLRGKAFRGARAKEVQDALRQFNFGPRQPFKIKFRRKNILRPLVCKGAGSWQGAIIDCADEDALNWFLESDADVISRLISLLRILLDSNNKPIILTYYNELSSEHFQKKIDVSRYWRPDLLADHRARQCKKLEQIIARMKNEKPPCLAVPWDLADYLYGDEMPKEQRERLFQRNEVYMPPPVPGQESLIYQTYEWARLIAERKRRPGTSLNDAKKRAELDRLRQHILMATSDGATVHLSDKSTNPMQKADFALIREIERAILQDIFPEFVVHMDSDSENRRTQVFFIPKHTLVSRTLELDNMPEACFEDILLEEGDLHNAEQRVDEKAQRTTIEETESDITGQPARA